ncbi:MAG TPA: PP2C family serine/threonine-protein phosphatase [Methanomicrobiales archaeon]|nr:PP2C family serine/threonine-protein phosphatase [Methanomicrobiales archaeon]
MPVSISPVGWACGSTRRGTSHARDGRPCQDAHAIWSSSFMGEPILAVAVADGHGGQRHDLSHRGAALAVQAAVGEVIASLPAPGDDDTWRPVPGEGNAEFHNRVNARWREYVAADAGRRAGISGGGEPGPDLFTRYGSTLLLALIDRSECWVGQIGDGDILLVRPDGSIEAPIPKDETLLGTVTYSLSSRDSPGLWRTARFPLGTGGLLLMATDGLSDSFENPESEFRVFARSLLERVTGFGIERVGSALPGWLDGYSQNGSGDDMTLVLVSLNPAPGAGVTGQNAGEAGSTPGEGTGPGPGGEKVQETGAG